MNKLSVLPMKFIKAQIHTKFKYKKLKLMNSIPSIDNEFFIKDFNGLNISEIIQSISNTKFYSDYNISQISKLEKQLIINEANDIIENKIKIFDSTINLGFTINWHKDYLSDFIWDKDKYYLELDSKSGADVKNPWELSRFNYLNKLSQAFIFTNDSKYILKFKNLILNWISENKCGYGINWKSPMDVSIRVVNFIISYLLIKDELNDDQSFVLTFLKSIYEHGYYIKNNYEKGILYKKSNHYISNITGMLFISIFLKGSFFSKSNLNNLMSSFEKEIKSQVYSDGFSFEGSTHYHKLVLEMFFYSKYILELNTSLKFSNNFSNILKKMFIILKDISTPLNTLPQVGDNDGGQLIKFNSESNSNVNYCFGIAQAYYGDNYFETNVMSTNALFLFGSKYFNLYNSKKIKLNKEISKYFKDSGLYVKKTNNYYILVQASKNGQSGLGGHSHNDLLSFIFYFNNKPIFVDSGTGLYTSDIIVRNKFRSTSSHNTVKINSFEQRLFKSVFSLSKKSYPKWINLSDNKITISHNGYFPIIHKRTFEFSDSDIVIIDEFNKFGLNLEFNLIVSPEINLDNLNNINGVSLLTDLEFNIQKSIFSETYNNIKKSKKLVAFVKNTDKCKYMTKIKFIK